MRKAVLVAIVIVVAVGGLLIAGQIRKPKAPPPTTQQIWANSGVPVKTAVLGIGDMEQTVEVTGDIDALKTAAISPKIPGRLVSISVREGDRVSQGQTVAVLDQEDARNNLTAAQSGLDAAVARLSQAKTGASVTRIQTDAAIEQAQSNLTAAEAGLRLAKNPARSQERMMAENNVASAKANLDNAESNHKRYKMLLDEGAVSEASYDIARTQYLVAQAAYKSASEQLEMIREGGRTETVSSAQAQVNIAREALRTAKANAQQVRLRQEDIKQAEAGVKQARASVGLAEQQLANTFIKSPISGVISMRSAEPGQVVSPGQPVLAAVNLNSLYLKGDLSEKELPAVTVGQKVRVRLDALPHLVFPGHVAEVFPAGSTSSRSFGVRITLDKVSKLIKPGMTASAAIVTGTARNVLLVPKDAIDIRKGTPSVFTVNPDQTVTRHVIETASENGERVQVKTPTNLKMGDIVVTEGRQNLQEGLKVKVNNGG